MTDLSPAAQTILWVLIGFIIAINLSLVFAFLHRKRDQEAMKHSRSHNKMPWESREAESIAELARRVDNLRKEDTPSQQKPPPR